MNESYTINVKKISGLFIIKEFEGEIDYGIQIPPQRRYGVLKAFLIQWKMSHSHKQNKIKSKEKLGTQLNVRNNE